MAQVLSRSASDQLHASEVVFRPRAQFDLVSYTHREQSLAVELHFAAKHFGGELQVMAESFRNDCLLETFTDIVIHLIVVRWEHCTVTYFFGNLHILLRRFKREHFLDLVLAGHHAVVRHNFGGDLLGGVKPTSGSGSRGHQNAT